jgi:hypothetical protein
MMATLATGTDRSPAGAGRPNRIRLMTVSEIAMFRPLSGWLSNTGLNVRIQAHSWFVPISQLIRKWHGDEPVEATDELAFHGLTGPQVLAINSFNCRVHPMMMDWRGADASASFSRADFGMNWDEVFKAE